MKRLWAVLSMTVLALVVGSTVAFAVDPTTPAEVIQQSADGVKTNILPVALAAIGVGIIILGVNFGWRMLRRVVR